MSDNDLLSPVRDSLSGLHMQTPVERVMKTGTARRRRRRATLTGLATASGVTLALIATSLGSASHTAPPGAGRPQLAAFTLPSGPAGATNLTLNKDGGPLDPAAIRQALAQHGIPAVVTVGELCDTNPDPDGVAQVISPAPQADGVTINPAAIPQGTELSFGLFPNSNSTNVGIKFHLINENAALQCSTDQGQPGQAHHDLPTATQ